MPISMRARASCSRLRVVLGAAAHVQVGEMRQHPRPPDPPQVRNANIFPVIDSEDNLASVTRGGAHGNSLETSPEQFRYLRRPWGGRSASERIRREARARRKKAIQPVPQPSPAHHRRTSSGGPNGSGAVSVSDAALKAGGSWPRRPSRPRSLGSRRVHLLADGFAGFVAGQLAELGPRRRADRAPALAAPLGDRPLELRREPPRCRPDRDRVRLLGPVPRRAIVALGGQQRALDPHAVPVVLRARA